ncbi:hypothetical protein D3C81_1463900 [compost metagenome]
MQGHRRGRPAAAAASGLARVVGATGGAEDRVVALRAEAELRGIGLADQHRAGRAKALDHDAVALGQVVTVQRRAQGGANAAGQREVLHRMRQAMHPAAVLAARQFGVACIGLGQQLLRRLLADDGVDRRIEALDMPEIVHHHFVAGHLALANEPGQFMGLELDEFADVVVLAHTTLPWKRLVDRVRGTTGNTERRANGVVPTGAMPVRPTVIRHPRERGGPGIRLSASGWSTGGRPGGSSLRRRSC